MKTSNILLIIAFGAVLIALTAFNLKLKCSYNKGDFRSEYYGMDFSPISGVTHLAIEGANTIMVRLRQGEEEGVWIKKQARENIDWNQASDVLTIQLTEAAKASEKGLFYDQVTIVLKDLEDLKTYAYLEGSEDVREVFTTQGKVIVEGFTQTKLNLEVDDKTNVKLERLTIDTLAASIGRKDLGTAKLELGSENKIKVASFAIPGKSMLTLNNPAIDEIQYRLSGDASVSLRGKPVQKLND